MNVSLDDLAVFAAVASRGSFRETSRTRGLSPTAVSRSVRRLESELGLTLLERTTRSVFPTREGERLLQRLVPALLQVEAAVAWATSPLGPDGGSRTVGAAGAKDPSMPELDRRTWP